MTIELDALALPERFPDERWNCSFNWAPKLRPDQTVISATFVADPPGSFDITNVVLDGARSYFTVSGGCSDPNAEIHALAALSGGEDRGDNILAPIKRR